MSDHEARPSQTHTHEHGPHCGHTAVEHEGHQDYLDDGKLHLGGGTTGEPHSDEVNERNPARRTPTHSCRGHELGHMHGPGCGHEAVPHGDHHDYLVSGHLHHPCDAHWDDHGSRPTSARPTPIRPPHDRLFVECAKEADRSKGGIVIPDSAKEKPIEGDVLAAGNGRVLVDGSVRKIVVNVGDRVLFGKYGGTEVKIDGENRLIIREDDILAVLDR